MNIPPTKGLNLNARGLIVGGNWNNGSNNGRWASNFNNTPTNTNNNIGFRCALLEASVGSLVASDLSNLARVLMHIVHKKSCLKSPRV